MPCVSSAVRPIRWPAPLQHKCFFEPRAHSGELHLDAFNNLVVEMYRAAREMPARDFPDCAFGIVKALLPFDSARLLTVEIIGKGARVHEAHLQNEPDNMVLDWEEISRHDTVMDTVIAAPGKAFAYGASSLYAGPEKAIMRDYAKQYGHQAGLVVVQYDQARGYWDGLSLYRAKEERFSEEQGLFLECLMPHLAEAITVNRLLAERAPAKSPVSLDSGVTAIASFDRSLLHCGPGFEQIIRMEWPDWDGGKLPQVMWQSLRRAGSPQFVGDAMTVGARVVDGLVFLRAAPSAPLHRLSPRELEVARLFGDGKTYKEIARTLMLSPATVRNFLQRVYQKLKITGKAELASMLVRHDSRQAIQ